MSGLDDLCFFFVVLGIVLTVVTLVGHGIWVVLAILFRGPSPAPSGKQVQSRSACPRCYSALTEGSDWCGVCDWPRPLPQSPRRRAVLAQLQAQLEHFAALGTIDENTPEQLAGVLATQLAEPDAGAGFQAVPGVEFVDDGVEVEFVDEEVIEAKIVATEAASQESSAEESTEQDVAPPPDVHERARRYAESRHAAAVEVKDIPEPPTPVRREALSRVLAAFMEERNIRWGELVGGLLIVGCSIALVISFWAEIAERPLLKFGIFNGVSAALFGAGFYTLRRWQIHTTSQGLLIIATLLVPLNFLAIAAFTQESPPTDVLSIGGELLTLGVFATLCYLAARSITPLAPSLLTVGVMFTSLAQLITRRFAGGDPALTTQYALAMLPVGCYLTVTSLYMLLMLRQQASTEAGDTRAAGRLFILLGVTTYATLLPLGLLVYQSGQLVETLSRISPLVSLFGAPALATGLVFWRRASLSSGAAEQTIGISVGVAGAVVMALALVLAWPDPALLLPTSLMTAVLFAGLALKFDVPQAHLVAAACALVAWLVGYHALAGNVAWALDGSVPLLQAMFTAVSGNVLVALAGLLAAAAMTLRYFGRRAAAHWYLMATTITAAISLALIVGFGFAREGDPTGVTWTLGIYALACVAATLLTGRIEAAWSATALLLATIVQGMVFRYADTLELTQPWVVAMLLHATLVVGAALALRLRAAAPSWALALHWSALATSLAAAGWLLSELRNVGGYEMAAYLAWTAGVWLLLAVETRWAAVFSAFQLALGVAVASAVVGAVEYRDWYKTARYPWLDPWFVQAAGMALAAYCLVWTAIRVGFSLLPTEGENGTTLTGLRELVGGDILKVDRLWELIVLGLLAFVTLYAAAPGVAQELALTPQGERVVPALSEFVLPNVAHQHTAGWGAWLLLLSAAAMVAAGMWRDFLTTRVVALLVVGSLACCLLAAGWTSDVAAASALRWAIGGYAILASVPIWGRFWLRRLALRAGMNAESVNGGEWDVPVSRVARTVIIVCVLLAYAAMGAYVATTAVGRAGVPRGIVDLLGVLAIVCVVTTIVAATIALIERTTRNNATSNGIWSRRATLLWQTLLMMGAAPLLAGCIYVVADALRQYPVVGPTPGTWFAAIGTSASYGVPLAAIIVALLGHAVRERSPAYAFSSALLVNLLTTIVFLVELARAARPLDSSGWIALAQINAIAAALFSLAWLTAQARWGRRASGEDSTMGLVGSFVAFGVALCGVTIGWGVGYVSVFPHAPGNVAAAGDWLGWIALALIALAVTILSRRMATRFTDVALAALFGLLVSMVALTVIRWDQGNWLAYHTLLTGFTLASCAAHLVPRVFGQGGAAAGSRAASLRSSVSFAAITVVLCLRALWGDPQSPWWTVAGLLAMALLMGGVAWETRGRRFAWGAAALLNLAASIWWIESGHRALSAGGAESLREFVYVNVIAAAVTAIYSVVVDRARIARESQLRGIAWHNLAVWGLSACLLLVVFAGLLADVIGVSGRSNHGLAVAALLAAVAVAGARLWDPASRFTVACLYSVGAIGPAMLLDALNIVEPSLFLWSATMFAACYALVTNYLWSRRTEMTALAARCGVPLAVAAHAAKETSPAPTYPGHTWLLSVNGLIGVLVVAAVFWIECTFEVWMQRNTAAYAIAAQAFAFALLSRGPRHLPLQNASLVYGVLFAVTWGLSWLAPDVEGSLLNRAIVGVVALAVVTPLYGLGLVKIWRQENDWTRASQRLVPTLIGVLALLVTLVIGGEVAHYVDQQRVPVEWPALVAVALALVGLAAAALAAAVVPGRDPLGLSERARTAYVYAAEVVAVLLLVHLRVTMPWLFSGWFQQFWPLIVMGVAFAGVGVGELCQRRGQRVLSEPLERTSALLPLLPVMGFWVVFSEVNYSLLLLTVGILYGALATLRRSFFFSILAVLAVNGSLWRMLYLYEGLGLAEHPQLWLIPPAVCVLVASHLNRTRLSQQQLTTIRYLSAIVIYAASTADIFLNGVANAPWLPGVLAVLAIVGIFAGIMLRVRAFLFLGTTFLLVALMTIIWYAAVERSQTWIWWVSGIVAGLLIITLFGLFEKKRDDVLRVVEDLKQWQA